MAKSHHALISFFPPFSIKCSSSYWRGSPSADLLKYFLCQCFPFSPTSLLSPLICLWMTPISLQLSVSQRKIALSKDHHSSLSKPLLHFSSLLIARLVYTGCLHFFLSQAFRCFLIWHQPLPLHKILSCQGHQRAGFGQVLKLFLLFHFIPLGRANKNQPLFPIGEQDKVPLRERQRTSSPNNSHYSWLWLLSKPSCSQGPDHSTVNAVQS